jgi:endo-1,4-beta-xylanase
MAQITKSLFASFSSEKEVLATAVTRRALIGSAAMALAVPNAPAAGFGLAAKAARTRRLFGTCLDVGNMDDADYLGVIVRESSILVPGNALKANVTRASPAAFDFSGAEQVHKFAAQNGMAFRGHTLCWYRSMPAWVPKILTAPAQVRRELYMEVREPCAHFKGRVHSWDVVNEAFRPEDAQPFGLRRSYWQQMIGPDFIDMAFTTARQADVDALLCMNEMDIEYDHPFFERKRQMLLAFVGRMRGNNVPIDVIGIQSHLQYAGIPKFPFSAVVFQRFLSQIADLGLRVIISELDVPDRNLPADIAERDRDVAACTGQLIAAAVGHPAVIAVVCWGLSDRYAWMDYAPGNRRRDGLRSRSMLFDDNLKPKLAYAAAAAAFDQAV